MTNSVTPVVTRKRRPRNTMSADEIWEVYQEKGSLRAAGRHLNMNHMVVRSRLMKAGYNLEEKQKKTDSLSPDFKVYIRPAQSDALDKLAIDYNLKGRHEMARYFLDRILEQELEDWDPKAEFQG